MVNMKTIEEIIEQIFKHGDDDAEGALRMLLNYGQTDGAHHKTWVINQALRHLAGVAYEELIEAYKNDGEYDWDEGIAP